MRNTKKKPVLEKLAKEGFVFSSQLFEWDIYSKGNERVAYSPKKNKIMTTYKIKEKGR